MQMSLKKVIPSFKRHVCKYGIEGHIVDTGWLNALRIGDLTCRNERVLELKIS